MKAAFLVLVSVLLVSALTELEYQNQFNAWTQKYDKVYAAEEFQARYAIWKSNKDFIDQHNKEGHSFTVAMNAFGDLSIKEFSAMYKGLTPRNIILPENPVTLPTDYLATIVDWRTKGAVTGVKNQGQCGSCWTFSSTGAMEGQWKIAGHNLVGLSEQQIVDCCTEGGGCSGGWMDWAFAYVIKAGGSDTEASYPYTARNGPCKFNPSAVAAKMTSFTDVAGGSETALQSAVASVGPVAVAIDASHSSFQFYSSGVYYEPQCSTTALDHAVLAVGYGTDDSSGKAYWLVKNSWGMGWGMQGYIEMSKGVNNNCGIASKASYPHSS